MGDKVKLFESRAYWDEYPVIREKHSEGYPTGSVPRHTLLDK